MKNIRLCLLTLVFAIASFIGLPARAITCIDNLYYEFDSGAGTAKVVRTTYLATTQIGRVIIPPTVKYLTSSYTVTEVAANAFYGLYGLDEIVFPSTMQTIGEKAFINCSGLKSVTFPASVTTIGSEAFSGCNLTNVVCEATTPPYAGGSVSPFSEETLRYGTLSVPRGFVDIYRGASGWSRFNTIRYIGQVDPTGITMETTKQMNVGTTSTLQATITPANATERDIFWKSSNSGIVSVDSNGNLRAVETGTAIITATTANGLSATCSVTVVRPVTALSIASVADMHVGDSQALNVTITPSNATDKSLSYTSTNSNIVSVSADGVITALALGSATIRATAKSGVSASVTINVVPTPVSSISLPPSAIVNVGETYTLAAIIYPSDATYKSLTWSSSNPAVVRVDASGKLTGVAIGTADVTATAHNGEKATVSVTVVPIEVSSIELSASELKLAVGKSASLVATILPNNATDKTITWTSSNEGVATVNEAGRVTAVGVGHAIITARSSNGLVANCSVDADIPVSSITIDTEAMGLTENKVQLKATEQIQVQVIINPDDATDKSLTFSTTDATKASVDAQGIVTANAVGTAIITVTASSGVKTILTVQVIPTLAESVTLNLEDAEMEVGDELQIAAVIAPATTTDKTLVWKSSDPSVASVSAEGLVKAASLGETEISATTTNGIVATAKITVVATPATSISVTPSSLTLDVGAKATLKAEVLPENTTDKTVTWISSDEDVIVVDANGNATAIAEGLAMITAMTADGTYLSASCDVTVNDPAGIDEISANEIEGEVFTLTGLKIEHPSTLLPGIYILRNNGSVKKIRMK